jgi:hypothetical protein
MNVVEAAQAVIEYPNIRGERSVACELCSGNWQKRASSSLKCPVQEPVRGYLAIMIAPVYVNTTSTTQRLFAHTLKPLNAPNVGDRL